MPNLLSSPSLSKRTVCVSFSPPISPSAGDRDVVEALELMENGYRTIVVRINGENDQTSLDWNMVTLRNQQNLIEISGSKAFQISIRDIQRVHKLDNLSIGNIRKQMDIPGLDDIGLQSLTLKLSMKSENEPDYFLIFEEYQNAFVWKKGLDTLLQMRNRGETVTTTIAFCCSSLDRINNDEMYSKMSIVDVDQASQWIECINSALPSIEKHIDRIRIFSEKCCILDSSKHLSLLLRTNALNELYMDAKRLSSLQIYELTKDEKYALREVWLSLLADLTVAMLKEHQLRADMTASIAVPSAIPSVIPVAVATAEMTQKNLQISRETTTD